MEYPQIVCLVFFVLMIPLVISEFHKVCNDERLSSIVFSIVLALALLALSGAIS